MGRSVSLSRVEQLVLELLVEHGELYGLEMVSAADGQLKRGTVYVTLGRMQEKGLVESSMGAPDEFGIQRRKYTITGKGDRLLRAVQAASALMYEGSVFAR